MLRISTEDRQHIGLLLMPSWFSGLVAVTIGLIISLGVIVAFSVNNSTVKQQLVSWQEQQPEQTTDTTGTPGELDERPTLAGSWPLLIIWSFVGLIVYWIVAGIITSFNKAEELRESLDYVNVQPEARLKEAAEHLALRIVAAIVLIVLLIMFFKRVIPYSILAAHASAVEPGSLTGVLYAVLSFAIVAFSLHIQTVFARLAWGRPRLFSEIN